MWRLLTETADELLAFEPGFMAVPMPDLDGQRAYDSLEWKRGERGAKDLFAHQRGRALESGRDSQERCEPDRLVIARNQCSTNLWR